MLLDPYESSSGRYTVGFDTGNAALMDPEVPSFSNELFDLKNDGPALQKGQVVKSDTIPA